MRAFILSILVLLLAGTADAQTFQVCTQYPNAIATDLSDAKAELIKQYRLKPSTTNGEAQAMFVVLGIQRMLEQKIRVNERVTLFNAVQSRLTAFEAAFPNPAPRIVCGDSVVDAGEECDTGAARSDTIANRCRTNCINPWCGDRIVDAGEVCDDGPGGPCADTCQ